MEYKEKLNYAVTIIKRSILFCIMLCFLCVYKCPIQMVFHINCPGCGMTRAILSALHLEFREAFRYHNLFPLVILIVVYQMFRDKFYIGKEKEEFIIIISLLTFILRWYICIV